MENAKIEYKVFLIDRDKDTMNEIYNTDQLAYLLAKLENIITIDYVKAELNFYFITVNLVEGPRVLELEGLPFDVDDFSQDLRAIRGMLQKGEIKEWELEG